MSPRLRHLAVAIAGITLSTSANASLSLSSAPIDGQMVSDMAIKSSLDLHASNPLPDSHVPHQDERETPIISDAAISASLTLHPSLSAAHEADVLPTLGDDLPYLHGIPAHPGSWRLSLSPKKVREAVNAGTISEDIARFAFDQQNDFYEWAKDHRHQKLLVVNIPSYELRLYQRPEQEGDTPPSLPSYERIWQSKSIVGRPGHASPDPHLNVVSLKYNPTWTPTRNMINKNALTPEGAWNWEWIDQHSFLPYDRRSGDQIDWIQASSMPLDDIFFVEPSGERNTLGQIKFETDSQNYIYLHDTNTPWFFDRNSRALSSGCVRVEKPVELAAHLAGKDPVYIQEQISTGTMFWEKIPTTPFFFMYDILKYNDQGDIIGIHEDPYGKLDAWRKERQDAAQYDELKAMFDYEIEELPANSGTVH